MNVCFCAAQAAEKALYAAHFSKDSNYKFDSSEESLPVDVDDEEIRDAADALQKLLRNSNYLRYPNQHQFPLTPHDVIDRATSRKAVELATIVVEKCQRYVDSAAN
jgi:HEPN domain-containing protein